MDLPSPGPIGKAAIALAGCWHYAIMGVKMFGLMLAIVTLMTIFGILSVVWDLVDNEKVWRTRKPK